MLVAESAKFKYLNAISKHCSFQKSLTFNKPHEYNGVQFWPISCEYLIEFYLCINVLMVHQEWIREKKLAKLPYLWFIVYACEHSSEYDNQEYGMYLHMLHALLEMSTKSDNIRIQVERKENGDYKNCVLFINDVQFNYNDFNEVRKIILEQAGIPSAEFDEFINEDAYKAIQDGREFENKQNKHIPAGLEDLVDILAVYLGMSVENIQSTLTIRKFNNFVKRMQMYEDWRLLKGAEMGGLVSFKQKIPDTFIRGFDKFDPYAGQNTNYMNEFKKAL